MRLLHGHSGYLFQRGHAPMAAAGRKREPKVGASATEARPKTSRIDLFADLVGVETDQRVADLAGVSRSAVTAWRARNGIAATAPRGRPKKSKSSAPRGSRLDSFRDQMGKVADGEIARLAGVRREVVGEYRRKHDIPAYDGFRSNRTDRSPPARTPRSPAPFPQPQPAASLRATQTSPARRKLRAYTIVASVNGAQREFTAVGVDITEACERAQAGLEARSDGPWLVDAVRVLGEALG